MPSNFRIEHVARVPRGWQVRTVTQGDHEVRIAFPPGRRRTGSGHVVEILHPQHENPSYCPSRARMANPAELVLMGANPMGGDGERVELFQRYSAIGRKPIGKATRVIFPDGRQVSFTERLGKREAIRQARDLIAKGYRGNPLSSTAVGAKVEERKQEMARREQIERIRKGSRPVRENTSFSRTRSNARYAIRWHTGSISHAMRTRDEAERLLQQFHNAGELIRVNPLPLRRSNPLTALDSAEAEAAREVRDGFVHQRTERYIVADEPHIPAGDYAEIGMLHSLVVKPTHTGQTDQVQELMFTRQGVRAIAAANRRQIYFAGGTQMLTEREIRLFTSSSAPAVDLGECRGIVYVAKKYHPEVGNDAAGKPVEWDHKFGEETGVKPSLWYDRATQRLELRGGEYRVEDAGIVN